MKPLITLVAIAILVSNASAAEIPAGTHLLLSMEHSINTRSAKVGDGIHMRTLIPIPAGGKIAIPVGTYAEGVITAVRGGRFQVQLVSLLLPSGDVLTISSRSTIEPDRSSISSRRDRTDDDARLGAALAVGGLFGGALIGAGIDGGDGSEIGALAGLGAGIATGVILAIVHHRHGNGAELKKGTALDVVFEAPVQLPVRP